MSTENNVYAGLDKAEAKQEVKEVAQDAKEAVEEKAAEAGGVLSSVWSAVSNTVGAVVSGVTSVATSAVDSVVGAKDATVEKTSEVIHNHPVVEGYVEAGKEKVAAAAAAASDAYTHGKEKVAETTGAYVEAGKEKAAALLEAGKEKLHEYPTVEGYVNAGVEKAAAAVAAGQEIKEQAGGDYIAAGKQIASQLTEQAKAAAPAVIAAAGQAVEAGKQKLHEYPTVEGYVNAGVEKAAAAVAAGQEKLHNYPTVEGYVNAGVEKASAVVEAGKQKLGAAAEKAGEVKEQVAEKAEEAKQAAVEKTTEQHAKHAHKQHDAEVKADVKELYEKTHGDEVDATGHIAVGQGHSKEKESAYVGGWETVDKKGHHHPADQAAPAK